LGCTIFLKVDCCFSEEEEEEDEEEGGGGRFKGEEEEEEGGCIGKGALSGLSLNCDSPFCDYVFLG
jgi:hypothetical protein